MLDTPVYFVNYVTCGPMKDLWYFFDYVTMLHYNNIITLDFLIPFNISVYFQNLLA